MVALLLKDEVQDEFSFSKPGSLCDIPVNSLAGCKKAANILPTIQYVEANGTGHDLPYGCIVDKLSLKQNVVYWNPNGVAVSSDRNIRQVCKSKAGINEGKLTIKYFLLARPSNKTLACSLLVS